MKTNPVIKVAAFLLAVLCLFGAAGMLVWQMCNTYAIWEDYGDRNFDAIPYKMLYRDSRDVLELIEYYRMEAAGQHIGTYAAGRMEAIETALSTAHTNVRWRAANGKRETVFGNSEETPPSGAVLLATAHTWSDQYLENDSEGMMGMLHVELWVDEELPVEDTYARIWRFNDGWRSERGLLVAVNIILALVGLGLTIYLCIACCHRKGQGELYRNWFHRVPGDLLLCLMLGAGLALCAGIGGALNVNSSMPLELVAAVLILSPLGLSALAVGALVTFAARCKTRTLLKNTLIVRLILWVARWCRRGIRALPLVWKAALVGVCYLLFSAVFCVGLGATFVWVLVTVALVGYLCWWAYRWKLVRRGTHEIVGGNFSTQIDTRHMPPDLRDHAGELNNLGQAIGAAVEERLRSEHFKAELITNVSHDLKTPLTSIISYVDLLKKERIDNPKAVEYIEVLDRKSQRLKKLTEDLVEASKASTGAIQVERERLDVVQLVDQALGEYEERLAGCGLTVVRTLPESPVWVMGDGRHLWRVMDNLLSNCAKYALGGTRVYAEVQRFEDCARVQIKNISRDALNVPVEQLTQRFVRGDASRTAEGSGLGLSIAQSLTELQGGRFTLSVDGDLFKAEVTLPLAEREP